MRRTVLALAGLVSACALSAPALAFTSYYSAHSGGPVYAAYSAPNAAYSAPYYADPLSRGTPDYYEQDLQPQAAPVPRQLVQFDPRYAPGSIVISTEQRRLYYVTQRGEAIQYGVGVGRPGFEWAGTKTVTMKREWPDWRPPAAMLKRRPDLPRFMEGGPDNPLGARAMYLGSSIYRIHGSNEPETIGQAVSSGCIRMTNEDVVDLYNRVKVGAQVVVLR
jgi:lipoprotein-anchoring transpeptidase ErfK/SrfK